MNSERCRAGPDWGPALAMASATQLGAQRSAMDFFLSLPRAIHSHFKFDICIYQRTDSTWNPTRADSAARPGAGWTARWTGSGESQDLTT